MKTKKKIFTENSCVALQPEWFILNFEAIATYLNKPLKVIKWYCWVRGVCMCVCVMCALWQIISIHLFGKEIRFHANIANFMLITRYFTFSLMSFIYMCIYILLHWVSHLPSHEKFVSFCLHSFAQLTDSFPPAFFSVVAEWVICS